MSRAPGRIAPHCGYTLVELLVVLAVLAVLAAVSWPSLRGPLRKSELQAAAKQLRVTWGKARLETIETGTPRLFRFRPGSGRFEVVICRTGEEPGTTRGPSLSREGRDDEPLEDDLPADVRFQLPPAAGEPAGHTAVEAADSGGQWAPPILFFPDGKTSHARVRLVGQRGLYVDVTLRGLTGSVAIGPVRQREEQQ